MTTRNSVTGDAIKTKVAYGESAKNFERGWELLQQGSTATEEVKPLPVADDSDFLMWMSQVAFSLTKGYNGMWNYLLSRYEQETETTPDKDLLYFITKGE
jgi:hypothetical protein